MLCDASPATGLGHFMRSASLARTLAGQGVAVTIVGDFQPLALEMATRLDLEVISSCASVEQRAREISAGSRIIIDSYHFDPQSLPGEHRYLLIDDFCRFDRYPVAGVVNFTINAEQYDYLGRGAGAQALGTAYFLPNPMLKRTISPPPEQIRNILIVIGSNDRHKIAARILKALDVNTGITIRVIGNHPARLRARFPQVEFVASTASIGTHYAWADLCITGGGLAKYECAWLGKPAAVISQTEAEHAETRQFASANLCFDLGFAEQLTAMQLADGLHELLDDTALRCAAQTACVAQFSQDSAAKAAQFARHCLHV